MSVQDHAKRTVIASGASGCVLLTAAGSRASTECTGTTADRRKPSHGREPTTGATASAQQAAEESRAKAVQVMYSVRTTGSGILSVTYSKKGFQISQDTAVSGGEWSKTAEGPVEYPNVNAQNAGDGTITCTIERGGEVIVENSSSGSYAVVACG